MAQQTIATVRVLSHQNPSKRIGPVAYLTVMLCAVCAWSTQRPMSASSATDPYLHGNTRDD